MIRSALIICLAAPALFSQIMPLLHQVKSMPYFQYPGLARIAKIQGRLDMVLVVENGKVVSVRPPHGVKVLPIPQLASPSIEFAKGIVFHSGISGEFDLHLIYRIIEREGHRTRMEVDPLNSTITIESDTPPFSTLPAKVQ